MYEGAPHPFRESLKSFWMSKTKTLEFGMGARGEGPKSKLAGAKGDAWDGGNFLAHARLILALACAITVGLNPAFLGRHVASSRLLIFVYLTYSIFNSIMVRLHRHHGLARGLILGAGEVVITSLIIMFTGGAHSYFLGLYVFVLLSAAGKWGFKGAIITSCACTIFLFSDSIVPSSWFGSAPNLMRGDTSLLATMALAATLVLSASLLGLCVEGDNKRYRDARLITRLVRSAIPELSFRATLGSTLISVREHFDADMVRLAVQEGGGELAVAWEVTRLTGKNWKGVYSWKLTESARGASFAMPP